MRSPVERGLNLHDFPWQLKIGSSQGPSGPTAHHSTFSHSSTHSSDFGISEKAAGGKDLAGRNKPIQVGPHVQLVVFPWISLYLFLGKIWQNQWEYNINVTNNMAGSITNHSPEKCVYFGIVSPITPLPNSHPSSHFVMKSIHGPHSVTPWKRRKSSRDVSNTSGLKC